MIIEWLDNTEFKRIKQKMLNASPSRFWGDDFDVRFYLISQLKKIQNKVVLDIGGGVGIMSSELNESNARVNLDICLEDLKYCKKSINSRIECVCASMTNLPFKDNTFDYVICSHLIEVAKFIDIKEENILDGKSFPYPTVEQTVKESRRVLQKGRKLLFTTTNNSYYEGWKLSYDELKAVMKLVYPDFTLSLFNCFPRISKKYRKLNLANVIPKVLNKFLSRKKIIEDILLKNTNHKGKSSVSFYLEAIKS